MKGNLSALYSEYIIDGVRMESTPGRMLRECMAPDAVPPGDHEGKGTEAVIDETIDMMPGSARPDSGRIQEYLQYLLAQDAGDCTFCLGHPSFYTRLRIASAVIDSLWTEGHFRLENLLISVDWTWETSSIGHMAAFYASAEAASGYIYDLGLTLRGFSFTERGRHPSLSARITGLSASSLTVEDEEPLTEIQADSLRITDRRKCPDTALPQPRSILIYIPFDTCAHRLGGSLLERLTGPVNDHSPEIRDPDYFIDCYEVVRELVEDGIVLSAATVADGGLLTAVGRMCKDIGATVDVSGIVSSYMENDIVKILFAEIPGVLIQVGDNDYDYVDGQLLLQDIAYYPIGSPCRKDGKIAVSHSSRSDVAAILAALLYGQGPSEGED